MTEGDFRARFTRADGSYLFARWGRPLVPVVFGVDDATLAAVKGALQAVAHRANRGLADIDPELGAKPVGGLHRRRGRYRAHPEPRPADPRP